MDDVQENGQIIDFNELDANSGDMDEKNDENDPRKEESDKDMNSFRQDSEERKSKHKDASEEKDQDEMQQYYSYDVRNNEKKSPESATKKQRKLDFHSEGFEVEDRPPIKGKNYPIHHNRDLESDLKTVEFGIDTINVMDHIEALNSVATYLLNKPSMIRVILKIN